LSQTLFTDLYLPLWIGGEIRGRVRTDLVDRVAAFPEMATVESGLRLRDDALDTVGRSAALQSVAVQLRKLGLIADWRNELCAVLDTRGRELARCERGLFRTLGLQNRAVHVNGIRTDGRVWVSRRSAIKRADPGKLDTLAAGGVLAGESLRRCAIRELWEEAGVIRELAREIDFPGVIIHSLREATFGIHDQQVIVADLVLDEFFEPVGRDGEVEEFLCLEAKAVRSALEGGEFTVEAALATRECLERRGL
jgi:8-oxo-dGTP pyrophosphatase MutT (NUDIX family)